MLWKHHPNKVTHTVPYSIVFNKQIDCRLTIKMIDGTNEPDF